VGWTCSSAFRSIQSFLGQAKPNCDRQRDDYDLG